MLRQWYIGISKYADELVDSLSHLPLWPDKVKKLQTSWIGRSVGMDLKFEIANFENEGEKHIKVFTTRPDTIYGVKIT